MKRVRKGSLSLISLAALAATAFTGVTAGTLAWYAYSRTITVSYVGTSVAKSVLLNVGIVDDYNYISNNTIATYDLERVNIDGHSIVFTHSTNGLDYHAIQDYLFDAHHAVDKLFPITTQTRALNAVVDNEHPFNLYKSPEYGDTNIDIAATQADYAKIPFAFRIDNRDSSNIINTTVWLTDASVQASGEHIDRAVRVLVENKSSQRSFLMKPADRSTTPGATKVGGLLDLDGDGTYDFDKLESEGHEYHEYYYGDRTTDDALTYADDQYGIPQDSAPYSNVNGILTEEGTDPITDPDVDAEDYQSTFFAKHNEQARCVDLTNVEAALAEFETLGTVMPAVNESGEFYEDTVHHIGQPICATNSAAGIGYADFTIFIEGWDHSVVDKSAGYTFNLGLKFEVNRI